MEGGGRGFLGGWVAVSLSGVVLFSVGQRAVSRKAQSRETLETSDHLSRSPLCPPQGGQPGQRGSVSRELCANLKPGRLTGSGVFQSPNLSDPNGSEWSSHLRTSMSGRRGEQKLRWLWMAPDWGTWSQQISPYLRTPLASL